MVEIHHAARSGFSKASSAYVSGRPGYPKGIDSWLRDTLSVCSNKRVVDRVMSVSFIATLSRSEREEVSRQVRRLAKSYPGLSDETDVIFPYRTFVAWTEKSIAVT